jgi:hypothetical protein
MHLGDLAAELQLQILQFCPPSRDLSTLSRTHTSLRDAAEYILYSDIDFRALPVGKLIEFDDAEDFAIAHVEYKCTESRDGENPFP